MTKEEKAKPLSHRIVNQLSDKWFELANDGVWITGGLLTCFLLTGGLAAAGSYLTFALYGVDCILMMLKCLHQWHRLHRQKTEIQKELNDIEIELNECDDQLRLQQLRQERQLLSDSMTQLKEQMHHQTSAGMVSMAVTVGLLIAFSLTLPVFTNPIIPLIGAGLILLVCLTGFVAQKILAKYEPCEKLAKKDIIDARIFKKKASPTLFKPSSTHNPSELEKTHLRRALSSDDVRNKETHSFSLNKSL